MTTTSRNARGTGSKKVPGYFRVFSRYISKRFLFGLLAVLIVVGVLYLTLAHSRVMQYWYDKQELPAFALDSPYLAGYSGRTQLLLSDGTLLYEGDINEAIIEGNGKLYRDNILIYEGSFLDGKYSGKGTLYSDSGALLYSGGFAENLYHGAGLLYNDDGTVLYDGMFDNGQRHGAGTLYGTNGEVVYDGMFENNLYHGAGTLHNTETSPAYTYYGTFSNGEKSGTGRLFRGDTLIYDGEFAHGLYEGQGKLHDGDKLYDGAFVAGLYEGVGKLYKNGSLMYEGEFAAGLYNGVGTEYNPETGYKMFEGRYLAGERMAAGITYDENGEAPVVIPEYLDPVSLLDMSHEDACVELAKAGISCRSITSLDGMLLLIDDAGSVVYNFVLDKDTAKPQYLAKVYLCNLSAAGGIVIGTDTDLVKQNVYATSAPGTLVGTEEAFALALSNRYWSRNAEISGIGSISYLVEDKLITTYYLPDTVPEPEPVQVGTEDDGTPIMELPELQPVRQGGIILFLKVEYRSDGGVK